MQKCILHSKYQLFHCNCSHLVKLQVLCTISWLLLLSERFLLCGIGSDAEPDQNHIFLLHIEWTEVNLKALNLGEVYLLNEGSEDLWEVDIRCTFCEFPANYFRKLCDRDRCSWTQILCKCLFPIMRGKLHIFLWCCRCQFFSEVIFIDKCVEHLYRAEMLRRLSLGQIFEWVCR